MFLFVAAGLNYADRTALSSVIPALRADIAITDAQIGLAGLLFLWSYAICSPFAGALADRHPRHRIVAYSLGAWSVVTALTGFCHDAHTLFGLRIALGIAESFYLPAAVALLAEHHAPKTLGRAMGLHLLGLNLGLVLGGSAAGLMAEHFGWRTGFIVLGALGLLLMLFAPKFLQPGSQPVRLPAASRARASPKREAWRYLLRVPSYHCLLLSAMAAGIASWIFISWLPLFFSENYGLQLGAAGLIGVALYKMPVFAGIAGGGWLSDRMAARTPHGRALLKALSFLLSAPFLFLFLGTPSLVVVASAMVLSSFVRSAGAPSEHPLVCEVVPPPYRATAVGVLNTCGTAAGGVGVLLAGVFKQDVGLNVIFGASSFIYLLAGILMLLAFRFFMARDTARALALTAPGEPSHA